MPVPARRALGAVMAVLGIALAAIGAWTALTLGPSGEVHLRATSKATGAIAVDPDVLNSLDLPVRVAATRRDGGAVLLAVGPSTDAHAVLGKSSVARAKDGDYPAGTLDLHASGTGVPPDITTADVWRLSAKGQGRAELVVDQGKGPETAVVTSGDTTALTNVTVTVTWAQRSWFFEALAATVIGSIIAAFAVGDLVHTRHAPQASVVRTRRSRVTS